MNAVNLFEYAMCNAKKIGGDDRFTVYLHNFFPLLIYYLLAEIRCFAPDFC
jgi:hypothetical protein